MINENISKKKKSISHRPCLGGHVHLMDRLVEVKTELRDFPGGPVVKTSPSNSWGAGLIPVREA